MVFKIYNKILFYSSDILTIITKCESALCPAWLARQYPINIFSKSFDIPPLYGTHFLTNTQNTKQINGMPLKTKIIPINFFFHFCCIIECVVQYMLVAHNNIECLAPLCRYLTKISSLYFVFLRCFFQMENATP